MSGLLRRRLALTFIAASALWSIQLGTSWAFDQARYPFQDAVEYPPLGTPQAPLHLNNLQSADLNGDGHLDLVGVASGQSGGGLVIATGDGAGNFADPETIVPGASLVPGSYQYALGDANGDGLDDLAVRESDGSGGRKLLVLLNDGVSPEPHFTVSDEIPVSDSMDVYALAPFGTGTSADLLVLDSRAITMFQPTASISVLPGHDDGTFGSAIATPISPGAPMTDSGVGGNLAVAAAADLDGDGIRDAVIGTRLQGQAWDSLVLKGRPNGTFEDPIRLRGLNGPASISFGDIDGDGRLDILAIGTTNYDPSYYALNLGGMKFSAPVQIQTADYGVWEQLTGTAALADFDGDGVTDIVAPSSQHQPVGIGYGLGPMEGPLRDTHNAVVHSGAVAGDFNEDGLPDVAVGGSSLAVLLHKAAPPFDEGGSGGVLGDVAASGTGLHVLKHHFPKSIPALLSNGVTATVSCDTGCDLRTRLVAHDGSIKTFHFPGATIARVQNSLSAGQVVKVRVKPTGHMAELVASGGAGGKSLGYGLRFNSTPAS